MIEAIPLVPTIEESELNLLLINLSLSAEERLMRHQSALNLILALQEASKKLNE